MLEYAPESSLGLLLEAVRLVAALSLIVVSVVVFRWTRRRDKLDQIDRVWSQIQDMNLAMISDPETAEVLERAIYGKTNFTTKEQIVIDYHIYFYLGKIQRAWLGYKRGLVRYDTYISETDGTLKLFIAQASRAEYLLSERGYSPDFAREMIRRIQSGTIVRPLTLQEFNERLASRSAEPKQ